MYQKILVPMALDHGVAGLDRQLVDTKCHVMLLLSAPNNEVS